MEASKMPDDSVNGHFSYSDTGNCQLICMYMHNRTHRINRRILSFLRVFSKREFQNLLWLWRPDVDQDTWSRTNFDREFYLFSNKTLLHLEVPLFFNYSNIGLLNKIMADLQFLLYLSFNLRYQKILKDNQKKHKIPESETTSKTRTNNICRNRRLKRIEIAEINEANPLFRPR